MTSTFSRISFVKKIVVVSVLILGIGNLLPNTSLAITTCSQLPTEQKAACTAAQSAATVAKTEYDAAKTTFTSTISSNGGEACAQLYKLGIQKVGTANLSSLCIIATAHLAGSPDAVTGTTTAEFAAEGNALIGLILDIFTNNGSQLSEPFKTNLAPLTEKAKAYTIATNKYQQYIAAAGFNEAMKTIEGQHINLSVLPGFNGDIWSLVNTVIQIISYTAGSFGVLLWIYESFLVIQGNDASITRYRQKIRNIAIGLLLIFASYMIVVAITAIFYNL